MTKLTFTKDDPPPPESLPDAPRARAASAAAAAPPEAPGEDAAAARGAFLLRLHWCLSSAPLLVCFAHIASTHFRVSTTLKARAQRS